ncbi:MAG TPA: glycosyltransferase family 4 protein [Elainellaceae cyanobacterium]
MVFQHQKTIALISVHGDPAIDIGKEEAGGQNVYVRHVGEALARLGWQVDMFTRRTSASQSGEVEHIPGCRTIRLNAGPADFVPRDEIFSYLPNFVEEFLKFQADSHRHYSIVHTNYWLSAWVGMELKKCQPNIRHIHTHHSLGAVKYRNIDTMPPIAETRLAVEKTCIETADRIIATSPQELEDMRSLVTSEGASTIIPCGTDIERFGSISRTEARYRLNIPNHAKVVFYVGRFDPRKGIETLVRAVGQSKFSQDANLRLIIGGGSRPGHSDGLERDRIEGLVAELGLAAYTTFPGRIDDADLPAYFAVADVCVVPSHYEPFGLVAIEAMASGTPVVASDVGGLRFTIASEETGLLAPPKDPSAFAEAIDRIIGNSEWQAQLGQAARHRVKTYFSWDGVAIQLDQLYYGLSANSTPSTLDPAAV